MKFSPSISTIVFDELLTTLEVIGVENTIKTLKEAKTKSLILGDINVDFIIKCVYEVTGVLPDRILFGIDRSDERKMALALLVYNVKNQCEYTYPQMKKIFNKDESALWRYYSIIDSLPSIPKTDFDKKLSSYSKKVNILITQRKLKK